MAAALLLGLITLPPVPDAAASATTDAVATSEIGACYQRAETDEDDTFFLDISSYDASYDCTNWTFRALTYDVWSSNELDLMYVQLGVGGGAAGCRGAQFLAFVSGTDYKGALMRTPSCDSKTWTRLSLISGEYLPRRGVSLTFDGSWLGVSGTICWSLTVANIYEEIDNAPRDGFHCNNIPTALGPPQYLVANAEPGGVRLNWGAPATTRLGVTDYVVEVKSGSTWRRFDDGISTQLSALVTGLTGGQTYEFRVAAVDRAGQGPWSASVSLQGPAVASAPRRVKMKGLDGSIEVSWRPPKSTGGAPISDYLVQTSINGGAWTTVNDGTKPGEGAVIAGTSNSARYSVRVAAVTRAGAGKWSRPARTRKPGPPVGLAIQRASSGFNLAWEAPKANGGGFITDYAIEVSTNGGNDWRDVNDPRSPLTTGTVSIDARSPSFRVAAINAAGRGAWSNPAAP